MLELHYDNFKPQFPKRSEKISEQIAGGIPDALKELNQWTFWGYENDKTGRLTKVPKDGSGWQCDKTDPKNHRRFADSAFILAMCGDGPNTRPGQETFNRFDGLGIVLLDDDLPANEHVCAIDLDHCLDPVTHIVKPWAVEIVKAFHTYTEVTPGGDGLRIIFYGRKPGARCRTNAYPGLEIYDKNKFLTITGRRISIRPKEIRYCQAALDSLYLQVFGDPAQPGAGDASSQADSASNGGANPFQPKPIAKVQSQGVPSHLTDENVLDRIRRSRGGVKFCRLWAGDISEYLPSQTHGGHSSADLALCSILVFWFGRDYAKIEQIFSQSGLNRQKWQDREDYRRSTINKAIQDATKFYDWAPRGATGSAGTASDAPGAEPTKPAMKACGCGHDADCDHAGIHPAEDRIRLTGGAGGQSKGDKKQFLYEPLKINIPTLSLRYSNCRRIKVAMYKITNRVLKRVSGFSCKCHDCNLCGPIWEAERIEWFSEILTYWPEIYSIVCDDEKVAKALYQRIYKLSKKGQHALYIKIPMQGGKVLLLTTHEVSGSKRVTIDEAVSAINYAIPEVPKGQRIGCSRPLAFHNAAKEQERTNEWKREPKQGPITTVTMEAIRDAIESLDYFVHSEDLKKFERLNLDFQVQAGEEDTAWRSILQKLFGPGFDVDHEVHVAPKYGGHAECSHFVLAGGNSDGEAEVNEPVADDGSGFDNWDGRGYGY